MSANDFRDDSFPPIWSAVNANERRGVFEMSDAGFVRFDANFGFDTAVGAYYSGVFGLNEVLNVAIARHTLVRTIHRVFKRF